LLLQMLKSLRLVLHLLEVFEHAGQRHREVFEMDMKGCTLLRGVALVDAVEFITHGVIGAHQVKDTVMFCRDVVAWHVGVHLDSLSGYSRGNNYIISPHISKTR
jgi:uncharacterized membrane protein